MAQLGKKGGLARAKSMSAKDRQASALKASKAAAVARREKAKARKRFAPLGNLPKAIKREVRKAKVKG